MPSREQHRTRGFNAAVAEYADHCRRTGTKPDLAKGIVLGILGGIAATLPDRFDDPSSGPSHRRLAHSWEAAFLLATSYQRARERGDVESAALLRAALTHHEDDAKTTAGLPSAVVGLLRWLFN